MVVRSSPVFGESDLETTKKRVAFSGLSPQFVGVNQVNIVVPAGVTPGNAVPLQISVGGLTSTNQVTMAIQ